MAESGFKNLAVLSSINIVYERVKRFAFSSGREAKKRLKRLILMTWLLLNDQKLFTGSINSQLL